MSDQNVVNGEPTDKFLSFDLEQEYKAVMRDFETNGVNGMLRETAMRTEVIARLYYDIALRAYQKQEIDRFETYTTRFACYRDTAMRILKKVQRDDILDVAIASLESEQESE